MSRKNKWQNQKIEFNCDSIEFKAAEGEGKDAKPPSFDMVAYQGGKLEIGNFAHPLVIDASAVSFHGDGNAFQPILRDHDTKRPVGHGTPTIEGGALHVDGVISQVNDDATEIVAAARNGFDWQASVGGKMTKAPTFVKAGKQVFMNGRDIDGPVYVVSGFKWIETSVVAVGADALRTTTKIAATSQESRTMKKDLKDFVIEAGFDPDDLEDSQIEFFKHQLDAKAPSPVSVNKQTLEDVVAKETARQARVGTITQLTADAMSTNPGNLEQIKALAELAVEGEWEVDKFELELLRATRATTSIFNARTQSKRVTGRVLEAAACMTTGLIDVEKQYDEQTLEAADQNYRNGLGLKQMIFLAAQSNGYRGNFGSEVTSDVMRYAFAEQSGIIQATSGYSTVSLASILSNVANKFVRQGFNSVDSSWRSVSAIRSVRDFKQITTNSLVGDYTMLETAATGELAHGKPGEVTYNNQASEFGRIIAISRRDIIDDDTSALSAIPTKLGRGGALALNQVFWAEFLDNSTFFAAGNNNVSTGVLDDAGAAVNAAEQVFYDQTDPDGNPLGTMPAIMLVPTLAHNTALRIVNSSLVVGQGADAGLAGNNNVYQGRYQVVTSPYMSNATYTGNSDVAWYMLANPQDMPVIETVFLNGRDTPTVESAEASFNTLGVQMRAYGDFGVAKQEYRGGVRGSGA